MGCDDYAAHGARKRFMKTLVTRDEYGNLVAAAIISDAIRRRPGLKPWPGEVITQRDTPDSEIAKIRHDVESLVSQTICWIKVP